MNKKGFTLVELLAVIAILGIIGIVAAVSMGGVKNKVDLKLVEGNINLILTTAKQYGELDLNSLVNTRKQVTVAYLKEHFELDIGPEYDNFLIDVSLKNRRAYACICGTTELENIVGSEKVEELSSYLCSTILGDVNNDNKLNCEDMNVLSNYLNHYPVSIYLQNADLDNSGQVNNKDRTALYKLLSANGISCS